MTDDSNSPERTARDTRATGGADIDSLARALSGFSGFATVRPDDLVPMNTTGLVHAHIRIGTTGAVLRVPRLGSFGMGPQDNLAYQAECFRRAAPSGHVPQIFAAIEPRDRVPWGALVISEIDGRTPSLPRELDAIAGALAAIHALPVPAAERRPPLPSHDDPVGATMKVIELQAGYLERAGLEPDALRQIEEEFSWAQAFAAEAAGRPQPVSLVGTDTHPGNFMTTPDGKGIFVDLEKMLYGAPAIDLAHASVYTSTMWDAEAAVALTQGEVAQFYDAYFAAAGADSEERIRPWCGPLRRFTWLRTTTWCAKWRVDAAEGRAWSPSRHDPAYLASVRARMDDYFDPATIARIRAGFADL